MAVEDYFMTKSSQKNMPAAGINLGTNDIATNQANAPGY